MKQYVRPEMEIDVFEKNDGLMMVDSCVCAINLAHGGGPDPWDDFEDEE